MTNSYLDNLLEQPNALQSTLDSLARADHLTRLSKQFIRARYRRVILTGMGSSYHGLYPLQLRLFASSIPVIRLETSELIHHAQKLVDPSSLLVAVSQSGQSAEVVQLLELTQGGVFLIGVTNTPKSALAENASLAILTRAGEEASVSCKTYISALAALAWLGDELTGEPTHFPTLAGLPEKVADYWSSWQVSVDLLIQRFTALQHIFLLGRGVSMAAACTGALIIKEAARVAAEGMNSAAFRHGPLELVSPRTFALVYEGTEPTSALNTHLVEDIRSAGGQAQLVSLGAGSPPFHLPECSPPALPILEILPVQMLTLALAEIQGIEAGQFIHSSKVTITE